MPVRFILVASSKDKGRVGEWILRIGSDVSTRDQPGKQKLTIRFSYLMSFLSFSTLLENLIFSPIKPTDFDRFWPIFDRFWPILVILSQFWTYINHFRGFFFFLQINFVGKNNQLDILIIGEKNNAFSDSVFRWEAKWYIKEQRVLPSRIDGFVLGIECCSVCNQFIADIVRYTKVIKWLFTLFPSCFFLLLLFFG